ncbi:3-deoxy-D-manno-octulosonic acid transferase [Yoonia sp. MH D7]
MIRWPDPILRVALWLYEALWIILIPLIYLYLRKRGKRDPLYAEHIGERFGHYASSLKGAVWVHAVSLGEMRSATPLVRALLARGDTVITTHFTPAGRREALREFGPEIAAGHLQALWVPFETRAAYRRFIRAFRPRLGLVMEIEVWPMMITMARKSGTPLYMCNAQYPVKSFIKDKRGLKLRARLFAGFAGGFVKSYDQKSRLAEAGLQNIHVTGELRFDQPIPQSHLDAAGIARPTLSNGREVITLTSVVEGEDEIYINLIKSAPKPLYIYVPRAPERFDEVSDMLDAAGLKTARRSIALASDLTLRDAIDCDVLLGDSMGEMYFYLGLCDRAIVGGGFVPKGAHNIIEPLALRKPVIVGPHIWTITYPVVEAIAAGVCTMTPTPDDLRQAVINPPAITDAQISQFYAEHAGSVARTLAAIDALHPH